jgi:rod shape-determining protein MreD
VLERRSVINLYLVFLFLSCISVLQSTIAPRIAVLGVKPDLMLLVVISWRIIRGTEEGLLWALIGGFFLDILSGAPFGVFTISLVLTSLLSGLWEVNVFYTTFFLPLTTLFFATLLYYLLTLFLLHMTGWPIALGETIFKVVLPSTFLNALLAPLFYKAMLWLSRKIERGFE